MVFYVIVLSIGYIFLVLSNMGVISWNGFYIWGWVVWSCIGKGKFKIISGLLVVLFKVIVGVSCYIYDDFIGEVWLVLVDGVVVIIVVDWSKVVIGVGINLKLGIYIIEVVVNWDIVIGGGIVIELVCMLSIFGIVYIVVVFIGLVWEVVVIGGDRLCICIGRVYVWCIFVGKVVFGVGIVKVGLCILAGREGVLIVVRSIRYDIRYVWVVRVVIGICKSISVYIVRYYIFGIFNI